MMLNRWVTGERMPNRKWTSARPTEGPAVDAISAISTLHKQKEEGGVVEMNSKPIWTPDTSGINWLADDPDSGALVAGLRCGFHVRLTFTSVSEIIANKDRERRAQLLRTCRLLLSSGDCIDPQHEIIRKMVARFEESPSFNWRTVPVDFP